jgi:diguanylate cyclase
VPGPGSLRNRYHPAADGGAPCEETEMSETGGPDQGYFNPVVQSLQQALAEAQVSGECVGLLLVHAAAIDRVDASHGFHAGDRMSLHILRVLRTQALRKRDLIQPVSRDEFACVLRPAPSEGIAMLAATRVLALLSTPIEFGEKSVAPDIAIGVATFPGHARDAAELLQHAKHALHSARTHRERICLFGDDVDSARTCQIEYEHRLRTAVEQNGLTLYFQPQLDVRTGRIVGAEALLRWQDDVLGAVSPTLAVHAAESAGLIDQLTMWVITRAIQSCAAFQKVAPGFRISINISPSNLREADLPFYVDRALRTWSVPGSSIVIEITETAMMVEHRTAHEGLRQLKAHGVRLSVDDFGTGYSSMHYLAQLPLDELKIDLMFVKDMLEQPQHAKIVRSLVDLAHNLDLKVVAEGVESEAVLNALAELGCDIAQGYYIGKPVPAAELLERLRSEAGCG